MAVWINLVKPRPLLAHQIRPTAVNDNDAGDSDTGPNNLQNFPEAMTATSTGSRALSAARSIPVRVCSRSIFTRTHACDSPSGHGEGKTYLGSTTTAAGSLLPVRSTLVRRFQSLATATDASGKRVEFSQCITTGAAPTLSVTKTVVGATVGRFNLQINARPTRQRGFGATAPSSERSARTPLVRQVGRFR